MNATKADAIQFLKSSIARYRNQLDGLQPRSDSAGNVVEIGRAKVEREQLAALIDDAMRLLSQLRTG
jgi:hypothetical protein